jgi:hypothetical protein
MPARIMARHRRDASAHTDWCARDHRCNLGEHRSPETIVDLPGHGRAVITRVRAANGREHAEIRARIALHSTETGARWQLGALLTGLDRLLSAIAIRTGVIRTARTHPAIDRRAV